MTSAELAELVRSVDRRLRAGEPPASVRAALARYRQRGQSTTGIDVALAYLDDLVRLDAFQELDEVRIEEGALARRAHEVDALPAAEAGDRMAGEGNDDG